MLMSTQEQAQKAIFEARLARRAGKDELNGEDLHACVVWAKGTAMLKLGTA